MAEDSVPALLPHPDGVAVVEAAGQHLADEVEHYLAEVAPRHLSITTRGTD